MNLVIDIGNTFFKIYIFEQNKISHFQKYKTIDYQKYHEYLSQIKCIKSSIISSVAGISEELIKLIQQISQKYIILNHTTPIPIVNLYKTPESLGKDRLAGIVGAYNIYNQQNVLAIDAGTAITFDFINQRGEYLGGNISPGVEMRFQALNHFTKNLPLLTQTDSFPYFGTSTDEAIISGVQKGILFEIDAYIDDLRRKYDDLKIILTGGDTFFFEHKLKNTIFAEPNLVAIGLNRILQYNVK